MQDASLSYVDDLATAEQFLSWLSERRPVLAIDTETTGIKWSDTPRLVQFGDGEGGFAVPLREWRGVAEAAMTAVAASAVPVVMHNSAFDQRMLTNDGFATPPWSRMHDTEIMSRLVDPDKRAGLKAVCDRTFGPQASAGQALLKDTMRSNKWTWATIPTTNELYWSYGVLDTVLTARLYEHLLPLVPPVAYDREMAVRDVLFQAEQRGIRIDKEYTTVLLSEWREEAAILRAQLQEAGLENPGSNLQVTTALKEIGWEPEEFTETGQAKLDKAILLALDARFPGLATPLLRYRRLTKWSSSYLEAFLREADGNDRIHPNIRTLGARTGRMSVTNPAFQTLPSREAAIRNCVLPYEDDQVLYAIDYQNMEMKVYASYTGDPALQAAARGEDFHRTTAAAVFNKPEADVTKDERSLAKTFNFASVYGAGPAKMALSAGVDEATVHSFASEFNARFPGAQAFKDGVERSGKYRATNEGQPYITTIGGRRVPCEDDKVYSLVNFICQGGAADVFKDALVALDSAGLGDHIVLPVHDEVLFSFPKDDAPRLAKEAQEIMTDTTTFTVPLTVDVTGPLSTWGEAYQ